MRKPVQEVREAEIRTRDLAGMAARRLADAAPAEDSGARGVPVGMRRFQAAGAASFSVMDAVAAEGRAARGKDTVAGAQAR